ncbi:MAG: hypothetical protein NTX75_17275 [Proteobacteria bacterium]|nr:hypothetical protein [Pseudomonadota bacterium]
MEDDLFDIFGISLFSSGGIWCNLNNMPCIPLSACEKYMEDDNCRYKSGEDNAKNEDE